MGVLFFQLGHLPAAQKQLQRGMPARALETRGAQKRVRGDRGERWRGTVLRYLKCDLGRRRGRPRDYNRPPISGRASRLQNAFFWPRGLPPRPDSIHHNARRFPRTLGARPRRRSPADARDRPRIFEVFRRAARLEPRRHTGRLSRVSREITRGLSHKFLKNHRRVRPERKE